MFATPALSVLPDTWGSYKIMINMYHVHLKTKHERDEFPLVLHLLILHIGHYFISVWPALRNIKSFSVSHFMLFYWKNKAVCTIRYPCTETCKCHADKLFCLYYKYWKSPDLIYKVMWQVPTEQTKTQLNPPEAGAFVVVDV